MNVSDFIFECVKNSKEAGALKIDVDIKLSGSYGYITIIDDGCGFSSSDVFKDGISSKGKDRGFGLGFIKRADPDASIVRDGDHTILSFKALKDDSLDDLFDLYFPLADEERAINLRLYISDEKQVVIERDRCKINLDFIRNLKREAREKEIEMSKLTLEELNAIRDREKDSLKRRDIHGKNIHIVVGMGTSGIENGAKVILNAIADEIYKENLENVILTQSGKIDDYPEPVVEVYSKENGLTVYGNVTKDDAVRIVKEHIVSGKILSDKAISNVEV